MLTNEIFDTFLEVLQPRTIQAPLSSLADGKKYEDLLSAARQRFEHALSEKLLTLSAKKQAAYLTEILGLFEERAQQFAPHPAFTWQDFERLSESPLKWAREPNETAALKEFRDKCEHQIATDLESFLVLYRLGSDDAKDASQLARLVTDYAPYATDGAFEMALDDEESQWIKNELGRQTVGAAQESVRQSLVKLVGKEAAIRWIWSVDRWYDMYRESRGLQPIESLFQHSCEAFHFYYQRPAEYIADQTELRDEPQAGQKITFRPGFTAENADQLAICVGLIDEQGNYVGMPGVAAGRLYGFYWALRSKKKVNGSLELLRDYFALRYLKKPIPSKPNGNSNVAQDMIADTESALKRLYPTAN